MLPSSSWRGSLLTANLTKEMKLIDDPNTVMLSSDLLVTSSFQVLHCFDTEFHEHKMRSISNVKFSS